jgi:hypothetical protein
MMPHVPVSRSHSLSFVISFACICQCLSGQAYNPSSDPLVERTINHGEQMMAPSNWAGGRLSDFDNFANPSWNYYNAALPTLYLPPRPPTIAGDMLGSWGTNGRSGFAAKIDREPFYAAYTYLASLNELTAKGDQRVDAYQKQRGPLLDEIRATFEKLEGASPTARAAGLSEVAARQAGRLQTLAAEAEAIRLELVGSRHNYYAASLVGRNLLYTGSTEPIVEMLFASSFFAGLTTEQRLLLPEIAHDQQATPRKSGGEWTSGTAFYFLPATARIRPPTGLPAALETKIRTFVHEKEDLKNELRAAVLRHNYFFSSKRTRLLTALAEQQAPRLAALEVLAEEIRVGLAGMGFPDQMADQSLPADLTQRVGDFYTRKVEVRRELANRMRELRLEFPGARFEIVQRGNGLAIISSAIISEAEASLEAFNAQQGEKYTAFAKESEVIRQEIQKHLAKLSHGSTRTVDQLAADFAKAYSARENQERSREYIRAVLEPGLSTLQRRLLFQEAVADVEQNGGRLDP